MTATWLTDVTSWVAANPGWLIAALFLTALIESLAVAGIIVPGVALLFAFAALAGKSGLPLSDAYIGRVCQRRGLDNSIWLTPFTLRLTSAFSCNSNVGAALCGRRPTRY